MITHLKAVYKPGEKLNKNSAGGTYNSNTLARELIIPTNMQSNFVTFDVNAQRLNSFGHGVQKPKNPTMYVRLETSTEGMSIKVSPYRKGDNAKFKIIFKIQDLIGRWRDIVYQLQGGEVDSSTLISSQVKIKLGGTDGYFYQYGYNKTVPLAYDKALKILSGEPYNYANIWTSNVNFLCLYLGRNSSANYISPVSGAAIIRAAQKGIVDLIKHKLEREEDYTTMTWYQMQYYVINTKSATAGVAEYVDSGTAEAWLRENHPLLTDRYDGAVALN